MMIGISKDDGDKIIMEFLVQATKENGTKRCAEESIKIMDDFNDSQLVISILLVNSMLEQGLIPEHVTDFETRIISALSTMFATCDKSDVPIQLQDLFEGTDEEIIDKVSRSRKMHFAIQQFVSAYYNYEIFENKYPEISKML
jgi:hypothetical protein